MNNLNKYSMYRALLTIAAIILNIILSCIVRIFGFNVYINNMGTIFMSLLSGSFSGIMTAVGTTIFSSIASPDTMFFSIVGVVIALITAEFAQKDDYKIIAVIRLIAKLTIVEALLALIINILLYSNYPLLHWCDAGRLLKILYLSAFNNILSVLIPLLILYVVPKAKWIKIRDSGWRQTPLSKREIAKLHSHTQKGSRSLGTRMIFMLMIVSVFITVVLGWTSTKMSYENELERGKKSVENAAEYLTTLVNADRINEYLDSHVPVKEYDDAEYIESNRHINQMITAFNDLEYVYIYQMREDACYIAFDTDPNFQSNGVIGEKYEYDPDFLKHLPAVLKGERIEPFISHGRYGDFVTAFVPIYDSNDNCVAYAAADKAMYNFSNYLKRFIINLVLVFSGFFVAAIACGLWFGYNFFLYPIGSIERNIDGFMKGINSQEELDESVKALQKIDVKTNDELERLYRSICDMAVGTANQMKSIRLLAEENEKMHNGLIITMANMVDKRDSDTGAHIQKTSEYVRIVLEGLKRKGYYADVLTDKYIKDVITSAPLHDVGKINIPDVILNKPDKLTDEEYEIMKSHTIVGKRIIENAINTVEGGNYLMEAKNMAAYHHERWDGKGYPNGMTGNVIPLSARVMAIADVFDALASDRVYKSSYSFDEVIEEIKAGSGTQFDPKCVEAFLDSIDEVKQVMEKYKDKTIE